MPTSVTAVRSESRPALHLRPQGSDSPPAFRGPGHRKAGGKMPPELKKIWRYYLYFLSFKDEWFALTKPQTKIIMKTTANLKRRDFLTKGGLAAMLPFTMPLVGFSNQSDSIREGRRVVTGLNSSGKSIVVSDGLVPENARSSGPKTGNSFSDLWIEEQVPVDLNGDTEPLIGYSVKTEPSQGGVTARIVTWEPGFSYPMHKTATLDFIFVISGQLELILEEGATIIAPGDAVIQRGTNHGWRVVGDEPCTVAAILLSALKEQ